VTAMKRLPVQSIAAGALMALGLASPSWAALKVGAKAPDFTAQASLAGKDFNFALGPALKKGPVVLYFYPSAFTGGCDLEAHTFAAGKAQFDAAGATILGVSADDLDRLNAFSVDPSYCAGQFPVASDSAGKIAASFGLDMAPPKAGASDVRGVKIGHGFIPRTTFVIASDGRIAAVLSSKADSLTPDQHMQKSLAIVLQLRVGKAKGN
jgi:peroxiredoxin Q/BCP